VPASAQRSGPRANETLWVIPPTAPVRKSTAFDRNRDGSAALPTPHEDRLRAVFACQKRLILALASMHLCEVKAGAEFV
jgi:hypothetical protein